MRKGTSSRRGDEAMFSGIEKQFYFYGRNRSLTTIRGASYKLDGTELSGYVCPFLRYLQSPRIDFSRWDIVIRCVCTRTDSCATPKETHEQHALEGFPTDGGGALAGERPAGSSELRLALA